MKYVVAWTAHESTEDSERRSLEVFSKWTPAATFTEFVSRLDNSGGFAVVETDNPLDVLRDTSKFTAWFDFQVHPVVDMTDAVGTLQEAVDFRGSIG